MWKALTIFTLRLAIHPTTHGHGRGQPVEIKNQHFVTKYYQTDCYRAHSQMEVTLPVCLFVGPCVITDLLTLLWLDSER